MKKLLMYATSPDQNIGYSRIGNLISNYLVKHTDIHLDYFAIQNFDYTRVDREVSSKINIIDNEKLQDRNSYDTFGINIINKVIVERKPDIFFIYNDIIVICRLLNELLVCKHKCKVVIYFDLVYQYEKYRYIQHINKYVDVIFTFSEIWTKHLVEDFKFEPSRVITFPHSFNLVGNKIDEKIVKNPDEFAILNSNRNAYRKANDLTIEAFIIFLKQENMNKNIKLILNFEIISTYGYDVMNLISLYSIKHKVDEQELLNYHIEIPKSKINGSKILTDQEMINLYKRADVGINTCFGEGVGLCSLEHALYGKPQIVNSVGGLKDIFTKDYAYMIEPVASITVPTHMDDHGGDIEIPSVYDIAKGMSFYYHNKDIRLQHGKLGKIILNEKYNTDRHLEKFTEDLLKIF